MSRKEKAIKIYPKKDSLIDSTKVIQCPFTGCDKELKNNGYLRIHLKKTHGIAENNDLIKNISHISSSEECVAQYHCPAEKCLYNNDRWFNTIHALKQHYLNLHGEKKYSCSVCGASFGLEKKQRRHEANCGKTFKCGTCECPYTSVEAMRTHCTRKQHQLPADILNMTRTPRVKKLMNRTKNLPTENTPKTVKTDRAVTSTEVKSNVSTAIILLNLQVNPPPDPNINPSNPSLKTILPKPLPSRVVPLNYLAPTRNVTIAPKDGNRNKKTTSVSNNKQTDKNIAVNGGKTGSGLERSGNGTSFNSHCTTTGIQTAISVPIRNKNQQQKAAAETQTPMDMILQKAMESANIPVQKSSVGTQMTGRGVREKRKYTTSSVGTQMTPRNKLLCVSETQTMDAGVLKKRRKRSHSGPRSRKDFTTQTVSGMPVSLSNVNWKKPRFRVVTKDMTCQTTGRYERPVHKKERSNKKDMMIQTGIIHKPKHDSCSQTNLVSSRSDHGSRRQLSFADSDKRNQQPNNFQQNPNHLPLPVTTSLPSRSPSSRGSIALAASKTMIDENNKLLTPSNGNENNDDDNVNDNDDDDDAVRSFLKSLTDNQPSITNTDSHGLNSAAFAQSPSNLTHTLPAFSSLVFQNVARSDSATAPSFSDPFTTNSTPNSSQANYSASEELRRNQSQLVSMDTQTQTVSDIDQILNFFMCNMETQTNMADLLATPAGSQPMTAALTQSQIISNGNQGQQSVTIQTDNFLYSNSTETPDLDFWIDSQVDMFTQTNHPENADVYQFSNHVHHHDNSSASAGSSQFECRSISRGLSPIIWQGLDNSSTTENNASSSATESTQSVSGFTAGGTQTQTTWSGIQTYNPSSVWSSQSSAGSQTVELWSADLNSSHTQTTFAYSTHIDLADMETQTHINEFLDDSHTHTCTQTNLADLDLLIEALDK